MQMPDQPTGEDAGATSRLLDFCEALHWDQLDEAVRHSARRHLLDTVGVMIQGSIGEIAGRAERVLADVRGPGSVPVPGRQRRADILDAAYLAGTAGRA